MKFFNNYFLLPVDCIKKESIYLSMDGVLYSFIYPDEYDIFFLIRFIDYLPER